MLRLWSLTSILLFLSCPLLLSATTIWHLLPRLDETLWPQARAVLVPATTSAGTSNPPSTLPELPSLPQNPSWIPLGRLLATWSLPSDAIVVGQGFFRLPSSQWTTDQKNFTQALLDFLARQTPNGQPERTNPNPFSELTLEDFTPPTDPPRQPQFRLDQASWHNDILSGRVRLRFWDQQKGDAESQRLEVRLHCERPAGVMNDDLPAGSPISGQDWSWVWCPADQVPYDALTEDRMQLYRGTTFTARVNLKSGDYLRPEGNLALVRPVNRGDLVKLVIVRGALSAELPATALDSGVDGQTVHLLTSTGKIVKAVVDGSRSTRVDWP